MSSLYTSPPIIDDDEVSIFDQLKYDSYEDNKSFLIKRNYLHPLVPSFLTTSTMINIPCLDTSLVFMSNFHPCYLHPIPINLLFLFLPLSFTMETNHLSKILLQPHTHPKSPPPNPFQDHHPHPQFTNLWKSPLLIPLAHLPHPHNPNHSNHTNPHHLMSP